MGKNIIEQGMGGAMEKDAFVRELKLIIRDVEIKQERWNKRFEDIESQIAEIKNQISSQKDDRICMSCRNFTEIELHEKGFYVGSCKRDPFDQRDMKSDQVARSSQYGERFGCIHWKAKSIGEINM